MRLVAENGVAPVRSVVVRSSLLPGSCTSLPRRCFLDFKTVEFQPCVIDLPESEVFRSHGDIAEGIAIRDDLRGIGHPVGGVELLEEGMVMEVGVGQAHASGP